MVTKIDHIGIAVKSLDEAMALYIGILKMELEGIETVESQGVRVAFLSAGNTRIELLEALYSSSPISKFIEKRGEGIHHIALGVTDIGERIREVKEKGITMINNTAKPGAHGAQVAFIHPKSTGGVLYEFCEKPEHEEDHQ
ncbi:methylmalonyl-CoA epimerase [Peribacillus saganii]|uniref:Methylmalonyl-CoA epimerase n=1 Tax=Peribacillus saganii TaxID=2303992 RepID=A0A372LDR7_9BACI|nr:methylmalonyl-CoA epimerase [Peribacillus saganii]RFU64231.1 methylmalonyl-CoA epimerase [Peribacillus saganii]